MRLAFVLVAALAVMAAPKRCAADDLLQVYAEARAADPLLASADAARGVQRELAVQARAGLLPQWSINAVEARVQQDGMRQHQLTSSLSQVLFDLGQLRLWDAASSLLSAQDAAVRAAEQDLCARVASAYFGVLLAQASLATTAANEDAFSQQVSQSQSRFKAGLVAAVDVDQARAFHELSRGATVQARQALLDAKEALAQITGRAPGELKPLAVDLPALPPAPADPQRWSQQALQANPSLQAQRLSLAASEQRIGAARAAHWPTVSVGVVSSNLRQTGIAPQGNGTQLALRLNIPLFAGGATQSQVRQAGYQRDATRDQLEITQRALLRETQAQYQAVLAGAALMQSGRAAVEASTQMLASTRAGQPLGTRTMTDLLQAIQTQAAAQNAESLARHRYVLATLLLQRAAGSLGEAELAAVNLLLKDPT